MGKQYSKRPKVMITPRVFPRDRALLQFLAEGRPETPDRYTALQKLIPIVESLDLEDIRDKDDRRAIRIAIPEQLDASIRRRAAETGQSYTHILLEAAREYRRCFPFDDSSVRDVSSHGEED